MDFHTLGALAPALLQNEDAPSLGKLLQLAAVLFLFFGPVLGRKKEGGKSRTPGRTGRRELPNDQGAPRGEGERRGADMWRQLLDLDPEPEAPTPSASSDPNVAEVPRPVTENPVSEMRPGRRSKSSDGKRAIGQGKQRLGKATQRGLPEPPPQRQPLEPTPSESELERGMGREDLWAEAGRLEENRLEAGGSQEEALERGARPERERLIQLRGLQSRSLSSTGGPENGQAAPSGTSGDNYNEAWIASAGDGGLSADRRARWRAAIIAAEVLGRPVALRDEDQGGPPGLSGR